MNRKNSTAAGAKTRLRERQAYGRLTTSTGTQYLYDRTYTPFALKRPGWAAEPYDGSWPADVTDEVCFGDARERTGRAPADPWNAHRGWSGGKWRSPRKAAAAWRMAA
jgi:hypothetical protein